MFWGRPHVWSAALFLGTSFFFCLLLSAADGQMGSSTLLLSDSCHPSDGRSGMCDRVWILLKLEGNGQPRGGKGSFSEVEIQFPKDLLYSSGYVFRHEMYEENRAECLGASFLPPGNTKSREWSRRLDTSRNFIGWQRRKLDVGYLINWRERTSWHCDTTLTVV